MFKRFTCMILSLVLLVALLPAAAIEASAASNATSDSAITILKKLESFSANCNPAGYIGYGTKCEEVGRHGITTAHSPACNANGYLKNGDKCTESGMHGAVHTIRENEASEALKKALKDIDTAINTFATNRGVSLTQGQHDALAVFSFENGTAWMQGTDDLQNAVVKGTTGQAFVNVLTGWKSGDDDGRRRVEANMYLNGKYDSYDPGDQAFTSTSSSSSTSNLVNEARVKATVTNSYINVRNKASLYGTKVGTVYQGDVLRIIKSSIQEANGYRWGMFVNESYQEIGYVALMYTNYDELVAADKANSAANAAPVIIDYATVTANGYVNVRSGAGTKNPMISTLRQGVRVPLYEINYVNGQKWGRTDAGWFSLAYASLEKNAAGYTNDYNYVNYVFTGTLKTNTYSKVYKEMDRTSTVVKDSDSTEYTITNITYNADDNSTWGKVSGGYVLLDEVNLTQTTYTTITEVTVRDGAGNRINTLVKGTEFDVDRIKADDNTVWGYSDNLGTADNKYNGWIDLSTQYVTRKGATITTEPDPSTQKCTLATVINCAEVNMRNMANIGGAKVGTLPAGTTVQVKEGPVNGTRKTGWYRLAVNNARSSESWVRGDYLDIREGTKAEINYGLSNSTITSPDGTKAATGKGMVANTYGGVNVRKGPGTINAKVTKLLPGTTVDILEVTYYGTTKWGRIDQGWVCMDYIAMMDYDDLGSTGGSSVNVTANAAVFEGTVKQDVNVYQKADKNSGVVRTMKAGDNVNVLELLTVDNVTVDVGSVTKTKKLNWARVNDGYICDVDEDRSYLSMVLSLNPLYEETYTVTGTDLLKVRDLPGADQQREDLDLKKGDQVKITSLEIVGDQVWGKFEHDGLTGGEGWICLSYCTRGAVSTGSGDSGNAGSGDSGNAGNGGNAVQGETLSIGNTGKGNYMGTIIGKYPEVNVRKDPDANAEKVTELKKGASVTITETKLVDGRSWGYCGTGWINLVYVDLTPVGITAIDAKVIATHNTLCYASSEAGADIVGSYASRAVVNIYEEVNGMYKTDMGWVSKDNFL